MQQQQHREREGEEVQGDQRQVRQRVDAAAAASRPHRINVMAAAYAHAAMRLHNLPSDKEAAGLDRIRHAVHFAN